MSTVSFADFLAGLDEVALLELLEARPDVLVEPAPQGFAQLAQRISSAASLGSALWTLNRDALVAGQAIALLGDQATATTVARLLDAPMRLVEDAVADLCRRGMLWTSAGRLHLPDRLAEHWMLEVGGGRPFAKLAKTIRAEDLRAMLAAWGISAAGSRKQDLIDALSDVLCDTRRVADIVARLPGPTRRDLDLLRHGGHGFDIMVGYGGSARGGFTGPMKSLVEAGLVVTVNWQTEVPREVAAAAWLAAGEASLGGRPNLPSATTDQAVVRAGVQAAAQETLRGLTNLLDAARARPIAALKKGGVGTRERRTLAARQSVADEFITLWIDLAHAAGLLGEGEAGYAPTDAYDEWRESEPAQRWALIAHTWFGLQHAPTRREIDDEKELPPPLPLASAAGALRRALLRAVDGGVSIAAAVPRIDWFCPLHGYNPVNRDAKVTAAIHEGELLGVIALDRVSELGEALLTCEGAAGGGAVAELAARCADLLPEPVSRVILQADLTATVMGQPNATTARLLQAAAVNETQGNAAVWRFTAESVRAALDAGWQAPDLLRQLRDLTTHPLPQPLEYLINDVARRHGHVRVRVVGCCLVADEPLITEILHTRSLRKLDLHRLAPTVLSSTAEPDDVLARLRAAGLAPVREDANGTVVIERSGQHRVTHTPRTYSRALPGRLTPAELAKRLAADPVGATTPDQGTHASYHALARLNRRLDEAELTLLAHALDNSSDITITYRDKKGNRTIRTIRPEGTYGSWLTAWCHLRDDEREFTIANIEAVSPAD